MLKTFSVTIVLYGNVTYSVISTPLVVMHSVRDDGN